MSLIFQCNLENQIPTNVFFICWWYLRKPNFHKNIKFVNLFYIIMTLEIILLIAFFYLLQPFIVVNCIKYNNTIISTERALRNIWYLINFLIQLLFSFRSCLFYGNKTYTILKRSSRRFAVFSLIYSLINAYFLGVREHAVYLSTVHKRTRRS